MAFPYVSIRIAALICISGIMCSPVEKQNSNCTNLLCYLETTTTTTPKPAPPQTVVTGVSLNPRIPYTGEYCHCSGPETGDNCNQVCRVSLATRPVCSLDTGKKLLSECHAVCQGEKYNFNLNDCNFIAFFSFLWN